VNPVTAPDAPALDFDPARASDLAELLDALPVLVAYVDAAGFNRYANADASRWLRKPVARVRGAHLRELLGEEGYRATQRQIEAALRGEKQEFDRVLLTSDGRIRHAVTSYVPRLRDGRPDGFFVVTVDTTSRVLDEQEHVAATVRSAQLEQLTTEAARVSDDVLQQLYGIGLHLERLQRHPERLAEEAGPVLHALQGTIDGLRSSITGLLLAGGGTSTEGVVNRLVANWTARTGSTASVLVDPAVADLHASDIRPLLTALSQILATAARHGAAPVRVRVGVDEHGQATVEAEGEDWPMAARADFDRMAAAERDDGGRLAVDISHPLVTRVGWQRHPPAS
jgi:PAS domain S-box-containing protein